MELLKGKPIAAQIKKETSDAVQKKIDRGIVPSLVTISAGASDDTLTYIESQRRQAEGIGIRFSHIALGDGVDEQTIIQTVHDLNARKDVHGIMIAHPLPKGMDEVRVLQELNPKKDIEGRTPQNLGLIVYEQAFFYPCTAEAVIMILSHYEISLLGKRMTIIGRSNTVGRPLALMVLERRLGATPTVCHTQTNDLRKVLLESELIVVAAGKAGLIGVEEIPDNCVVIDVGINVVDEKVVGDVDMDSLKDSGKKVRITPVPGGVGGVTTQILMRNVAKATGL